MSAAAPVELVMLWHYHQPDYRDPHTGRARLPWVRLHATKDYLDMAAHLARHSAVHATFNFVPSLLDQLEAAARGEPDDLFDLLARGSEQLAVEERRELERRLVHVPWHAAERWPDLRRLLEAAQRQASAGGDLGPAPLLALEVWFLLAWLDPLFHTEPEAARALAASGRFERGHRDDLLALHARLVGQVVPAYRALAASRQAELSASPYYHPILPLLVDVQCARRARPELALPREPFAAPGDARLQLVRALERHAQVFGERPVGVWPSEGSVSPEAVELVAAAGIRWLASDEAVLFHSLPEGQRQRSALYHPWALETPAGQVALFFRDRELSDRIGFVYQRWNAADAVADFLGRLGRIAREHTHPAPPVVAVILDGENCWEGYPDDGAPFLEGLYRALAESSQVRTTTPAEVLERRGELPRLSRLHSGSWIDADFHVWVGHPEKNRAWEHLSRARRVLSEHPEAGPEAWDGLLRAEGSDWFWWFGEDHYTPDKSIFDELFRAQIRAVYERLGEPVPMAIEVPVAAPAWSPGTREPAIGFIQPVLDGRRTHYYEWQPAGHLRLDDLGGAMHAGKGRARDVYYGFDQERFYLRLDFSAGAPGEAVGLRLEVLEPARMRMEVARLVAGESQVEHVIPEGGRSKLADAVCRVESLLELAIPVAALGWRPGDSVQLVVQLLEGGMPVESLPAGDALRLQVPDESLDVAVWYP